MAPDEVGVIHVVCTDCGLRTTLDEVNGSAAVWRVYADGTILCPDCNRRKDAP